MSDLPYPRATIFRVLREVIDGETVRVVLEPYTDYQKVDLHDGDEFITGVLNSDPWKDPKA